MAVRVLFEPPPVGLELVPKPRPSPIFARFSLLDNNTIFSSRARDRKIHNNFGSLQIDPYLKQIKHLAPLPGDTWRFWKILRNPWGFLGFRKDSLGKFGKSLSTYWMYFEEGLSLVGFLLFCFVCAFVVGSHILRKVYRWWFFFISI